ncbi:hypothetical protein Naga_100089g16 [Nannochloropsis gaditana]|uniref:Uncharacterized protein n=1 Tax=Nannochloropsis gaditana TaxID=72520 RepID=W7TX49_9STRA|nr:hypothetical protein Naga_100089g16 [Nannochloropsis gaditana]
MSLSSNACRSVWFYQRFPPHEKARHYLKALTSGHSGYRVKELNIAHRMISSCCCSYTCYWIDTPAQLERSP